jgi:hypothetical protein
MNIYIAITLAFLAWGGLALVLGMFLGRVIAFGNPTETEADNATRR